MNKKEILNEIKRYNKNMLLLRIKEKENEQQKNFDIKNAIADQISYAREIEAEETKKILYEYLKNKVVAYDNKLLNECSISDYIQIINGGRLKKW